MEEIRAIRLNLESFRVSEPIDGSENRGRDPRGVRHLARGLARVVTHEVVHAIDPEIPHSTTDSIMRDHLTPELLRRDDLGFSGSTVSRLVAAIARSKGTLPP